MQSLPNELSLLLLLLVTVGLLAGCWRLSRRTAAPDTTDTTQPDTARRLCDTLLWFHLAQYAAGALPGLLGILRGETILLTGAALAAAAWSLGSRTRDALPIPANARNAPATPSPWRSAPLVLAGAILIGLILGIGYIQGVAPPSAVDTLIYHFAAPVQWLQDGRLTQFDTWHHNPANTFSPLGGSIFVLWWYAPLGHDLLARWVQAPALLLLFAAAIAAARELGARPTVAALLALALVAARPFSVQLIVAKDDAFVAAFFCAAVAALSPSALQRPVGAWRLGTAVGLLLATKYTALYSLPLFLLAVDAPIRARWRLRDCALAIGAVALLAGPWYLRNLLLTGNPLFPMRLLGLPGLLRVGRAPEFSSLSGIIDVVVESYYALRWPVTILIVIGWAGALVARQRGALARPLERLALLGPPVGFLILLTLSPYPELRFVHPAVVLLFLSAALIDRRWPAAALALALLLVIAAFASAYAPAQLGQIGPAVCLSLPLIGGAWAALVASRWPVRLSASLAAVAALGLAAGVYVFWPSFQTSAREVEAIVWRYAYGDLADGWLHIRDNAAPGSTIALANSSSVYPLQGRRGRLRIVHVSAQPGVAHIEDLPPIPGTIPWRQVNLAVWHAMYANADRDTWRANLRAADADYLVVAKQDPTGTGQAPPPPELTWARDDPALDLAMENDAVAIWRVRN